MMSFGIETVFKPKLNIIIIIIIKKMDVHLPFLLIELHFAYACYTLP